MKFYSRDEFKKLNESEIKDWYIQVQDEIADEAIEKISEVLSDSQFTFDGLNFFSFGMEEDAKKALETLNDKFGPTWIVDSNLETHFTPNSAKDDSEAGHINEDLNSPILRSLRKTFKTGNKSWENNFYRDLAKSGIDVSRITDDDLIKIKPEEIFKGDYANSNQFIIAVNSDPRFKEILSDNKIYTTKDDVVLIGLFRKGDSVGFGGKEGHVGFIDKLKDAQSRYSQRDKDKIKVSLTDYLTEKDKVSSLSQLFGDTEKIEFNGNLNKKNLALLITDAYVISSSKSNRDLITSRIGARKDAAALRKDEEIKKENIERYRQIIANNFNIKDAIQKIFVDYNKLVVDVTESGLESYQVYNNLDSCTQQFSYVIRSLGEYYSKIGEQKSDIREYGKENVFKSKPEYQLKEFVSRLKEYYRYESSCRDTMEKAKEKELKLINKDEGSV